MRTFKKLMFTTAIASLGVVGCKTEQKPEEKVQGIVLETWILQ